MALARDGDETGGFDTGGSDTFHYTTRLAASVWLAIEIGALTRPDARDWDDLRARLFATANKFDAMFDWVTERASILSRRYRDIRGILGNQYTPYYHGAMAELLIKENEKDQARYLLQRIIQRNPGYVDRAAVETLLKKL